MIRYDLDRLGWHDFEAAIEVLLKAKLGIGIESWSSSRGDWGRDAYFKGTLSYPTNTPIIGEFVFQCKFVQGANAAGAKPDDALLGAVNSECTRIKKRKDPPSHYALITNAPLSPASRTRLTRRLLSVMPDTEMHLHGAADVCDWFDLTPYVVRAFPQVFGLRHLHELLRSWSRPDLIKRSKLLIDHAAEEAATFVATRAYRQALEVVRMRGLVMLEGPPEMGKTTIGRMLALAAIASDKVEALECRRPRDLFDAHDDERGQVFVVDDCFGRSSYDPALGTEWERELGSILRLLDANHCLVLTSRAHLLSFAISALDFDHRAVERLSKCRVVVDATSLSTLEKTQILYRHGKHARLSTTRRAHLREAAAKIVNDDNFTPERIRVLVERISSEGGPLKELIQECLTMPTASMRKSFRALRSEHRWLLYALLEQRAWSSTNSLDKSYHTLCPEEVRRPLEEVVAQLNNAFIRRAERGLSIDVVHPTVLDLVVEELALDVQARRRYLEYCGGDGLTIALMFEGGGRGTTIAPLLTGEAEWALLEARGVEELRNGRAHALELLRLICRYNRSTPLGERAAQALDRIGNATIEELNKSDSWTTDSVLSFARAMRGHYIPLVDGVWKRQLSAVKEELDQTRSLHHRHSRLQELSELAEMVTHSRRATIERKASLWVGVCNSLQWVYDREVWSDDLDDWGTWDDDDLDDAEQVFETIEEIIETLRRCLPTSDVGSNELAERIKQAIECAQEMESCCRSLRDAVESKREDVEARVLETSEGTSTQRVVDIGSIFEDL